MMRAPFIVSMSILALLIAGCSHPIVDGPAAPPLQAAAESGAESGRFVRGMWQCRVPADHASVEIVPLRISEWHFNALKFLEDSPVGSCITVSDVKKWNPNELSVDIRIRHPLSDNLNFTVFDVRGIFISPGTYQLPESGRVIAWGDDLPRLFTADGYTSLFNPTEFPEDGPLPDLLKYYPGDMATGGNLSSTLNPFMAYLETSKRGAFLPSDNYTRTYDIMAPDGAFEFGYAVDASWNNPGKQVIHPVYDFPPSANAVEATRIYVTIEPGLASDPGSSTLVDVQVHDQQGPQTISTVTLEAPDLFQGVVQLDYVGTELNYYSDYTGTLVNELGATGGSFPVLVRVTDTLQDPNFGQIDAFQVAWVDLKKGLSFRVGCRPTCLGSDHEGNIYVGGDTATGWLGKYDPDGRELWVRQWVPSYFQLCWLSGLALDENEDIFVGGGFSGVVDFDPGPGETKILAKNYDCYVSEFDSDGNFLRVVTWGGDQADDLAGIAADGQGNIFIAGLFRGPADLDPGLGTDIHEGNGPFLSKFNTSGEFQWARAWGSDTGWAEAYSVDADSSGRVCLTGHFSGTKDFDPGPGVDEYTAEGGQDAYLVMLDSNGEYQWTRIWSGSGQVWAYSAALGPDGEVCVGGIFTEDIDLDPGPGVNEVVATESTDSYMCVVDAAGEYLWAGSWGASLLNKVVPGTSGAFLATGSFDATYDQIPGVPGGGSFLTGAFLMSVGPGSELEWVDVIAGFGTSLIFGLATDAFNNILVGAGSNGTIDIDPGPGYSILQKGGGAFVAKYPPDGEW